MYKIHKQRTKDSFGNENMNETYEKDDANKFHKEYKSKTWQWENEKICITESRYRINSSKILYLIKDFCHQDIL